MADEAIINLVVAKKKLPFWVFFKDARDVFKSDELGREIIRIALPTALALTADPIASLIDTAFIGHIGPVELAAVGVSIALFNQISKVTIFPLVSVTTSFVAEEETIKRAFDLEKALHNSIESEGSLAVPPPTNSRTCPDIEKALPNSTECNGPVAEPARTNSRTSPDLEEGLTEPEPSETEQQLSGTNGVDSVVSYVKNEKKNIASASSAMLIGGFLGLFQAVFLVCAAKPLLSFMGVQNGSPMQKPATQYLQMRALGSPAILLSLAMQGIFRGFKDTKTPLYATLAGDVLNIILDPLFIFIFRMGVRGAAIAHIISQYLISVILLWRLMRLINLLPPSLANLQLGRFLKNGSMLLARVIAATMCVTLAAAMAARLGPITMAAFQICLQVWLATSLLADGLAVAGQALLASAFAEKDYEKVTAITARVLQHALVLGLGLSLAVGVGLHFGSGLFTKDIQVIQLIGVCIPFVAATQPINSLAFVFDGVNFGASDFAFSAYSMVMVAVISIVSMFLLFDSNHFIGIWIALTIYICLRMFAGIWRIGTGTGPWHFLRN
ncbi:hypothetical protein ACHQM5_019083 [Ranunculus cassubicifolius]